MLERVCGDVNEDNERRMNMIKHYITKGSKVEDMIGTFECKSYDGTYVWGILTDLDGSMVLEDCRLTLPEVAQKMRSMDGKNHKVFWEESEGEE